MSTHETCLLLDDILPQVLGFISVGEMYMSMRLVNKKWNECILNFRVIRSLYAQTFKKGGVFTSLLAISMMKNNITRDDTSNHGTVMKHENSIDTSQRSDISVHATLSSPPSCVIWDNDHFECILSCLKGKHHNEQRQPLKFTLNQNEFKYSTTPSNITIIPPTSPFECEKRATFVIQFIFSVIYDYKFQPSVATTNGELASDIGNILNHFKERLTSPGDMVSCLLNILPIASEYFGASISLLLYKLFERLLTLDAVNFSHWSKYFPNMKYAALVQSSEKLDADLRVKLFNMELDFLLDLVISLIQGGMSIQVFPEILQFTSYCSEFIIPTLTKLGLPLSSTCKDKCEKIEKSIIKNEKDRYFLMSYFSHLPEIEDHKLTFENNVHTKWFSNIQQNNLLLNPQFTYKTLAMHVGAMLDYETRHLSISDFLTLNNPLFKRSKILLRNYSCWNNLLNFLVTCIVQENDLHNRALIYEKIEQAMLYSFVLNDFAAAQLFKVVFETGAVHRLRQTAQAQKKSRDYELLLNECFETLTSAHNFRKLRAKVKESKYCTTVLSNPLTYLVFVFEGNSDVNLVLYHSTSIIRDIGKVMAKPTILYHYMERVEMSSKEEKEKENKFQIISKKKLKDMLKSMFIPKSRQDSNIIELDRELLNFFYFVTQQRKCVSDGELFEMSLNVEKRQQ
ncbi:hypothetical protein C9374_011997 [Naegleria lovaniensis]|uniref:Ras-GEF domain-containing protein n=1 Tax=Naegleria lovaniensis TaxID=51637 RepID=A0AA88KE88_NAELO|nr:uncharacterized protein C9374_011997 [Naegleria lovaniensis]KAG2373534.1 hypothetical protein C9374_011997 [Naegleria lovaniensis]